MTPTEFHDLRVFLSCVNRLKALHTAGILDDSTYEMCIDKLAARYPALAVEVLSEEKLDTTSEQSDSCSRR